MRCFFLKKTFLGFAFPTKCPTSFFFRNLNFFLDVATWRQISELVLPVRGQFCNPGNIHQPGLRESLKNIFSFSPHAKCKFPFFWLGLGRTFVSKNINLRFYPLLKCMRGFTFWKFLRFFPLCLHAKNAELSNLSETLASTEHEK